MRELLHAFLRPLCHYVIFFNDTIIIANAICTQDAIKMADDKIDKGGGGGGRREERGETHSRCTPLVSVLFQFTTAPVDNIPSDK